MYNVYKYTVLQRKLQILERTWFWSAQAACAYHSVGREWIRHICGNGKHDFGALISFAFETRHSSLPCGSKLSCVSQNLLCNITSVQSRHWISPCAGDAGHCSWGFWKPWISQDRDVCVHPGTLHWLQLSQNPNFSHGFLARWELYIKVNNAAPIITGWNVRLGLALCGVGNVLNLP